MYNEIEMHTLGRVLTYKIPDWTKVFVGLLIAGICYLIWQNLKKDEAIEEKDSEILSLKEKLSLYLPNKAKPN